LLRILQLRGAARIAQLLISGPYVTLHGMPNNVGVYLEVTMHQDVAHTDDFGPGNLSRQHPNLFWQGAGCLTNDLKMPKKPRL
jgi:uncharacterized protein YcsI (UPF0317 family)